MDETQMILLYDYYGDLLTQRQKECFELRYHQDLSFGEIGQELGISRQGVFDNLNRAEALLRNMEEKTGCVRRDLRCRKVAERIAKLVQTLSEIPNEQVSDLTRKIHSEVKSLEE